MSLSEVMTEHRRRHILDALYQCGGYVSNAVVLTSYCNAVGSTSTRAQVDTACAWLAEQGLVTIRAEGDFAVVTLTDAGIDAATGRAFVPGVARPRG
jgi:hypothetical protein